MIFPFVVSVILVFCWDIFIHGNYDQDVRFDYERTHSNHTVSMGTLGRINKRDW